MIKNMQKIVNRQKIQQNFPNFLKFKHHQIKKIVNLACLFGFGLSFTLSLNVFSEPRNLDFGIAKTTPNMQTPLSMGVAQVPKPGLGAQIPVQPMAFRSTAPKNDGQPRSGLGQQVNVIATPKMEQDLNRRKVQAAVGDLQSRQIQDKEVKRLKQINLDTMKAKATPYEQVPNAGTRTTMLNLAPGAKLPTIYVGSGHLTSLVFSDLNGEPWMIERVSLNKSILNDGGANASGNPTNILNLEPLQAIAYSNVNIVLKGLPTPVIFNVVGGNKQIDVRLDVKVPGRNPDSTGTTYSQTMPSLDESMPYFLDGVPPASAKKIKVTGPAVEAWEMKGQLYIRTTADVQYPAYHSSAKSTSGHAVYRFNQIYNSITLLQNGRAFNVYLEQ